MNELSLLDSLFGTDGCGYADGYVPSVDVQETKDAYVLTMTSAKVQKVTATRTTQKLAQRWHAKWVKTRAS